MCYSALVRKHLEDIAAEFGAEVIAEKWTHVSDLNFEDPTKFKFPDKDKRIFPGYIAPILCRSGERLVIEPMKYSMPIPEYIPTSKARLLTSYNARRDSLTKEFWAEAIGHKHGAIIIQGFYEWVQVADLVKSGAVGLEEIRHEFSRLQDERRMKWINSGKDPHKFKATKVELSNPLNRKIVIQLSPKNGGDMIVPVIFSRRDQIPGFAIITDDPTPEIQAVGHDRMPIHFSRGELEPWLREKRSVDEWVAFLESEYIVFEAKLPA